MRFLRTYIVLQIFSFLIASQAEAQAKKQTPLVLYLPSTGKMLTVPAAPLREQQYWTNNWQHYADTDSTDAIVMQPGILGTMLLPGYSPTKITQEYLDSLSLISAETLPVYYDTTQGFWKTLWEEQKKEYEASERRIQNIAVIVRKYGKEISARDTATQRLEILAVVPLVRTRAYKLPPGNSDIALPYLMTEEAHRNSMYSYGGSPLARLVVASDKILTRTQLKKIVFPKEGSRSRDTLYSVIAEEVRKNTLQTTRRMIVPESPVVIFDKLQKTIIRCVVATGRFLAFPGSFTVKMEGSISRLPKYKVVPESLTSVSGNIDQPCGVSIIFEEPFGVGEHKLLLEYRSLLDIIDTGSVTLRVLSSTIADSKFTRKMEYTRFYFGNRTYFPCFLPDGSEPLRKQCFIEWNFNNEPKQKVAFEHLSFEHLWISPYLSASIATVTVAILWQYPESGEQVLLFRKEFTVAQLGPEFQHSNAIIGSHHWINSNEMELEIKNFGIEQPYPAIDFEPDRRDPCPHCPRRKTLASPEDIKNISISLDTVETRVLLEWDTTHVPSRQAILCKIELAETKYDKSTGGMAVRVRIKKPLGMIFPDGNPLRLQGIITMIAYAVVINPYNKAVGHSINRPFSVLINIKI